MEGKSDMETVCCKVWGIMGSFAGFANFAPEGRMLPVEHYTAKYAFCFQTAWLSRKSGACTIRGLYV
ncbi:hypothetical protein [Neisseria flavescens]|uniref:hypothetical protein n=1 Tax=Neisseria TaxID=482 RepID=UPI0008A966D0|nr:hypothetical protein [Neisseria flavescens]OHQ07328.1 hypothetical protein HMPREF2608_00020 [Neisseria sp. HMSC064D07]